MTLELQAKHRLLSTEDPVDPTDTSGFIDTSDTPNKEIQNNGTFFAGLEAGADDDSVKALEEKLAQAQAVVDETKRALELHAMDADLSQIAGAEEAVPSTTLDENQHPNLPEGEMTINAGLRLVQPGDTTTPRHYFTKDEARAAFARFKAEQETLAGRELTTAELIAISNGGETTASFADDISDGDAFDMLIDGDPEQHEPLVQELTQNDGGTEEPEDQMLLQDDVSVGPSSL